MQEGFNPYHENLDLYIKMLNQERVPSGVTVTSISVVEGAKMSLKEVFQLYLKLEEMQINPKNKSN